MKKYIFLIAAVSGSFITRAQISAGSLGDLAAFKPAAQVSANFMSGSWSPNFSANNLAEIYPKTVNTDVGNLKFYNGSAKGANLQFGYFFGYSRHFGVGGGLLYMRHKGNYYIEDFHVEYESTDSHGEVFRQIIKTRRGITEPVIATNISVPIVGKYQTYFTDELGINIDAGLLLNVQMQNKYSTNAVFDYEAVYKYELEGDKVKAVYDNSTTPSSGSWLITSSAYGKANPKGDVNTYFDEQRAQGYNVGTNVTPESTSGTRPYKSGAIGFLIQPSVNYAINEDVMLNLGGYYMMQFFSNEQTKEKLTDQVGSYSTLLTAIKTSKSTAYGISVGLRYYLRFGKEELYR